MAPRKRLGRSPLTDLLAEEGRIGANREMRQLIPQSTPDREVEESHLPQFEMFGKPRVPRGNPMEIGENGGLTIDYTTQTVIDAKPPKDNYGQGPGRSTRVASHKFVPHSPDRGYLIEKAGVATHTNTLGTVYVKFQPHLNGSRANDVYKYSHVPESVYNNFANSNSKGRFINQFLNNYKYGRIGSRDDMLHTQDL